MHLVNVTEFPEEHEQLLVKLDLLGRMREVRLQQGVVQQTGHAFEDKTEVLDTHHPIFNLFYKIIFQSLVCVVYVMYLQN